METDKSWRKLDALCIGIKDRLKTEKYIEVEPYRFGSAIKTTLWHLWYGNPEAVLSEAREVAKGYGLDFEIRVMCDGRQAVIFRRFGH